MRRPLIILSALIVFALLAIAFITSNGPVSASEMLPATYIDTPHSFEGNSYVMEATIINQIASRDGRRLLMVRDNRNAVTLPVIIPPTIDTTFFPHQRYHFGVTVKNKHLLLQDFKKL